MLPVWFVGEETVAVDDAEEGWVGLCAELTDDMLFRNRYEK